MSEELEGFIILASGIVVFIYGLLNWIIHGKTRAQKFIEKAQKDGCEAEAVCVLRQRIYMSLHTATYIVL